MQQAKRIESKTATLATESLERIGRIQSTCDEIHGRLRAIECASALSSNTTRQQVKSKHFSIEELVPQSYLEAMAGRDPWLIIAAEDCIMLDSVRDHFNRTVLINTYKWGGKHQFRGYRPPECVVGAKYSTHRLARGWDISVVGISDDEVRAEIKNGQHDEWTRYIRRVENGTQGWVHIDRANVNSNDIVFFDA